MTTKLGTWASGALRGGRGYEGAPPDVRSDAFDGQPDVKAWIDADPVKFPRPDNPPAWVHDEATWERAKKAVEKRWGQYSEPWAVVTHVYYNMGGR